MNASRLAIGRSVIAYNVQVTIVSQLLLITLKLTLTSMLMYVDAEANARYRCYWMAMLIFLIPRPSLLPQCPLSLSDLSLRT